MPESQLSGWDEELSVVNRDESAEWGSVHDSVDGQEMKNT